MRKSYFIFGTVFSTTVFYLLMLGVALSAPFKTSEERIPDGVSKIVKKQMKDYFGEMDLSGVPLLDPKIDWNIFANWPDEFTFQGKIYILITDDWSHGDDIIPLKSRSQVKSKMRFTAYYKDKGTGQIQGLYPFGYWFEYGVIHSKSVSFNHQTVFHYHFYSSGRVLSFDCVDCSKNGSRREYFDRDGKTIGIEVWSGKTGERKWQGRPIDYDEFWKKAGEQVASYEDD